MKKIAIFEDAINNKVQDLKAEGINPTAFWAYRKSIEAENELIDFSEVVWESDIEEIAKTFKANGIFSFTISSNFSGLITTLAEFQKHGFQMAGLTEVNATYVDFFTGKREKLPAIRLINI